MMTRSALHMYVFAFCSFALGYWSCFPSPNHRLIEYKKIKILPDCGTIPSFSPLKPRNSELLSEQIIIQYRYRSRGNDVFEVRRRRRLVAGLSRPLIKFRSDDWFSKSCLFPACMYVSYSSLASLQKRRNKKLNRCSASVISRVKE